MGASKAQSIFLFPTGAGRVLKAELEKGFAKTYLIKNKTKYLISFKCLEKCVNSHIISMEKHFGNEKYVDVENARI